METELIYYNNQQKSDDKLFNFIIPTFTGGYKLDVIINCLLAQTKQNLHITVVSDGIERDTERQLQRYFDIENFTYCSTNKRYNDYGHTPRLAGLKNSKSKFSIMTGFDNYYVPTFVECFEHAYNTDKTAALIFCDFVLDHPRDGRCYNGYVNAKVEVNYLDFGCYAIDTEIANTVGIKIHEYAADWHLIADSLPVINKQKRQVLKIPQTLYVHN